MAPTPCRLELVEQQEPPAGLGREPEASSQSTQRMTAFVTEDAEGPEAHMASGGRVQRPPK